MELERQKGAIEKRGYGVAAISYDTVATLKAFADRSAVTTPLLSDTGSTFIRRLGLLNPAYAEGDFGHGVPFPGTFVLDARGVVRQRVFLETYQERQTAASWLLRMGEAPEVAIAEAAAPWGAVRIGASNADAFPGQRMTLVFEVEMAAGRALCGAGRKDCRAPESRLSIGEAGAVEALSPVESTGPGRYRIYQDVALKDRRGLGALLTAPDPRATIAGEFEIQTCPERGACDAPVRTAVQFDLKLRSPVR